MYKFSVCLSSNNLILSDKMEHLASKSFTVLSKEVMRAVATLSSRLSSSFSKVSDVVWIEFFLSFLEAGLVLTGLETGGGRGSVAN